ncbi:MAG TPA: NAD(P)H-hydrate dehydratase [Gemmatimonadaceae bacterium]|nr:NAD(P)H-hydrate dehydratase [Gemmatimonadaceae bacterium]
MPARVASAEETIACERATIEAGTPASELMMRAGRRAASVITARYDRIARGGVVIYAGSGNNGGDGWVVAAALAKSGISSRVVEIGLPRSDEARAAREAALESKNVRLDETAGDERLVVDALLGTGSSGSPRGEIAAAIASIESLRSSGATVVSLDLPSGLNATSGAHDGSVVATSTISFGVAKRGHLIARDVCGDITIVDIGLNSSDLMNELPELVDHAWVHSRLPSIPVDAHKGTRKRLAIVGGSSGMAGAVILSAQGALRSGIGLLHVYCEKESLVSVHAASPAAIAHEWPETADELTALSDAADCVAIGPGLGNNERSRDLVERILLSWNGPVVLDADALNVFAGDLPSLGKLLNGRDAVLTPHPAEMGRLLGVETDRVLEQRFEIGADVAASTNAAVLLKGSPTVVFSPSGARYVSASGTAALATGGSGDVLTGMIGTLLAQMPDGLERAAEAASCGAFVHGRAAERCRFVRGITIDDVLHALPVVWNEEPRKLAEGIIAELEKHA